MPDSGRDASEFRSAWEDMLMENSGGPSIIDLTVTEISMRGSSWQQLSRTGNSAEFKLGLGRRQLVTGTLGAVSRTRRLLAGAICVTRRRDATGGGAPEFCSDCGSSSCHIVAV